MWTPEWNFLCWLVEKEKKKIKEGRLLFGGE
jgi:hypothetical protein